MIYFIQDTVSRAIKIGYTRDRKSFDSRLVTLQTANPNPLSMLGIIEGNRHDEALLHKKFEPFRLVGEWFLPDNAVLSFISRKTLNHIGTDYGLDSLKTQTLDELLDSLETNLIKMALEKTNGNKKAAAKILGIKYRSLWHRIDKKKIIITQ